MIKKLKNLLIVFMFLFLNVELVNADTAKVTATNVGNYYHAHMESSSHFNHYGQILNTKITEGTNIGAQAYCIAPGEIAHRSKYYNVYNYDTSNMLDIVNSTQEKETNKLSFEQLNKMQLYAHYGFGYGNHNENIYIVATQMLIYRVIEPTVFTSGLCDENECTKVNDSSAVTNAMNEIQALVDKHYIVPSFHGTNLSMIKGETKTLTDTNNILNEFTVKECTNCTAQINGNDLNITATSGGKINIKLEKNINTFSKSVLFLTLENSQNFITNGNVDPIDAIVTGEAIDGEVEILKTDEHGKKLDGVKFEVYDSSNSKVCDITTSGGAGKCSGLKLDTYTVKEISTLDYLVKPTKTWSFTLTKSNTKAKLNITNEIIKGYIDIHKLDSENNSCTPQGDAKLIGAIYGVYDSNGTEVDRLIIDNNCYAKSKLLEYGHYTVKEISTGNEGYKLDPTIYNAFINENGTTINLTSKEDVFKFDFHLFKVKTDGTTGEIETEPNAQFDIYLKSKNQKVETITTDEKGRAKITLPYGEYNVCQSKGSDDSEDAKCFEIFIRNQDVDKVINNGPIKARIKVVKVDSVTQKTLPIAGIKFKIKNTDTGEYVCQTISYPNNEKVCVFETTDDGILYTPSPLEKGHYQLEELDQVIYGYLWNNKPLKFEIKKDSDFTYDDDLGVILEIKFANQEVLGKIIIHKVGEKIVFEDGNFHYEEIALKGIKFNLYDEKGNLIKTIITDDDGYAEFTDLKLGKYILKEIETLDGYILDDKGYEFNLKYIDQYTPIIEKEITLKNYLKKGEIDFSKLSYSNSQPLPNTLIEFYTINDELVFSGRTDKNGNIIIKNLKIGKYYFIEKEAPEGYLINDSKMYFEIKENGQIVKSTMKDEKITGTLEFTKLDFSTQAPIPNTLIEIYNDKDELIFSSRTDENGKIIIHNLEYGHYYILEKECEGYNLNTERMYFEIKENGQVVKTTMLNKKTIIDVPITELNKNYTIEIILGTTFIIGLGVILYAIKKKK